MTGWTKTVLSEGNGTDKPNAGDKVAINYTGWLRDPANSDDYEKGKECVYFSCRFARRSKVADC